MVFVLMVVLPVNVPPLVAVMLACSWARVKVSLTPAFVATNRSVDPGAVEEGAMVPSAPSAVAWERYVHALLQINEFAWVD